MPGTTGPCWRARSRRSTGKLALHIIGAIAEFERNLILERTTAGLRSAWAQGAKRGRRRLLAPTDLVRAEELLASPGFKAADVAAMLKVSARTLFRELRAARDREEVGAYLLTCAGHRNSSTTRPALLGR